MESAGAGAGAAGGWGAGGEAVESSASGRPRIASNTCHQCCQKIRSLTASCKQLKKKGKQWPTSDIAASACATGTVRMSKRLRRTRAGHAPSARTSATAASACEPRKLMLYW
ncbi:hypothetical protein ABZP36_001156 [Zizania latifolia]